ncbi:GGDEF domain-containing response regulator [Motiliproteus sp. MSK22-1]|uniref:EAL domain-containing response regulator n=1 Tax=Motiliproteus sp. MSK22-1 TaxID=1897630 RepID=UPI0013014892|nr:GGDEF domain-containing response regulator [Motiliproteus sp. MSK22-1]
MRTVSILVVDPFPATSHLIHDLLQQDNDSHYQVNWCTSIKEALTEPRDPPADLIFLDHGLEQSEHKNYLGLARRNRFPIPIVLIGDTIDIKEEQAQIEAGASDYLAREELTLYNLKRSIRYAWDLQERESRIAELMDYDELTGAPNRQNFYGRLMQRLDHANASGQQVGLMMLNIDGFKKVNNSLGHLIGDLTIKEVALRLQQSLKPGQQLARISEDQFTISIISRNARAELETLIDRIRQLHRMPYQQLERKVILGCSMGCAVFPETGQDLDELLRHAGTAMHQAKKERGSSFRFYSEGLDTDIANQIALEPELLSALRRQQFVLHYQPRIDLNSQSIVGAEALIRWQHPTRGLLHPGEFIPLAEKTGLIVPMGYWVVYRACKDLEALQSQGMELQRMGINLSFRQFQDDTLLPTIQRLISHADVDPSLLEFELTETAVALNEVHVGHCIRELSKLGLTFSLDDFGTGYSSFAHLQKLPINTLKIDRSFISGVIDNPDDAEIVRAIINLAHNLRKDVIAEGAETPEQVAFLKDNQCDQVQGYYYSPPVNFEAFREMLCEGLQEATG